MAHTLTVNMRFAEDRPISMPATAWVQAGAGGQRIAMTRAGATFTAGLPMPAASTGVSFTITVQGMEFWETTAIFSVALVNGQPLLLPGGAFRRPRATGSLAGGIAISLDMVVRRLDDITATFTPHVADDFELFNFDADILGAFAGTPAQARAAHDNALLNPSTKSINRFYLRFFRIFAGRATLAVYVPTAARPLTGSYIFYFKPPKHAAPAQEVAEIYLTDTNLDNRQLLANCELAGTSAVFCFLIGETGDPEIVARADVVADLLTEVDFFLRSENPGSLYSGVTRVALACFSEGGRLLNNTLTGLASSRLSATLSAVFVFDAWFGTGKLEEFKSRLRTWFAGGSDGKKIRIYQGVTVTDPDLFPAQATVATQGPFGTVQKVIGSLSAPSYFYLRMTEEFAVHHAARLMAASDLHHIVPKLFLPHALKTTDL